jgi:hypothetical protein
MHVCATLRSAATLLREKKLKLKNANKRKSHKVVIFHVCVGAPLSNRLQWKFAHQFGSATINRVNFCGCRVRGLVSAKGRT